MSFSYRRSYRGPIEAVLLDWAGTTMDFGCMAPAVVFVEVFKRKDVPITVEDVPAGRPHPYMCLQNVIKLGVSTVQACVKIDDTIPGVEEGLNAGMWTIGLAMSGNEVGLPLKEMLALPPAELAARRRRAYTRMYQVGAHYV